LCHTARHLGATLNWRRDPDYERRIDALRKDRQRIEIEIEQIKNETERLRRENKQLHVLESKLNALLLSPDSSLPTPPETDCS